MEALLRGMLYPGRLERRYNLRFKLAYAMENQTLPYGLGTLWYGAGARYSWKGICLCATKVPDAWDREHEIYWWVGADSSRLLMKWYSMLNGNQSIGGYAETRNPSPGDVVEYVDGDVGFLARYIYRIIGAFGYGWDDVQTLLARSQFADIAKNKTNASRQVYVSNEQDFFEDFEAQYGANLPSLSCSFGNEWDLDCSVMVEVSARARRAVEKLRWAEALACLVGLKLPHFMDGRQAARDLAFMNLGLFWEHDWACPTTPALIQERITWQKRITGEIETYVNDLYNSSKTGLGNLIARSGSTTRFYVFNPLSWARSDVADYLYSGLTPMHVVDLTSGSQVPSQIVQINGQSYVRILAQNVPPVGYRVYEIQPGAGQDFSSGAPTYGSDWLENGFYRLKLASRGAITSLLDKNRSNREFVAASKALDDLGGGTGVLAVENAGPVSVTFKATVSSSSPLKHTTRVSLLRGIERIEIHNTIQESFDSIYSWSFQFDLPSAELWHEELGAVIQARLTTAGGHYSPRNARYDWLTLNHFLDLGGSGLGITLSNADCYFFKYGNSTITTLDTATPKVAVLAGGDINGYNAIHDQGGDSLFTQRFALRTRSAYDPLSAMKFALEHQNPLVTGAVSTVTGGYPETNFSLLTLSNPEVILWALKPAEDGLDQGLIVRLWNLRSTTQAFNLDFTTGDVLSAWQTTHIETPTGSASITNGALSGSLSARQLKTYQVKLSDTTVPQNEKVHLPFNQKIVF